MSCTEICLSLLKYQYISYNNHYAQYVKYFKSSSDGFVRETRFLIGGVAVARASGAVATGAVTAGA